METLIKSSIFMYLLKFWFVMFMVSCILILFRKDRNDIRKDVEKVVKNRISSVWYSAFIFFAVAFVMMPMSIPFSLINIYNRITNG